MKVENGNHIFMPLKHDLLFKEAFAHPDNRDKLVRFLSIVLDLKENIIWQNLKVEYESVFRKNKINHKSMRGDVVVKFASYKVNLECYTSFDYASFDKSACYVMYMYSTKKIGEDYNTLEQVIQINIIDGVFKKFPDNFKSIGEYHIKDENYELANFKVLYYRIDKLPNIPYNELTEEMRWIKFIGAKTIEERRLLANGDKMLLEFDSWLDAYVNEEAAKRYFGEWAEVIATNKGMKKGLKEGRKKGLKEGRKEGLKEGKNEKALEIARNMLNMKMDIYDIIKATGLSLEKVKSLETKN